MIELIDSQISDIARELELGMKCFVNKKTGEIKSYPDELSGNGSNLNADFWQGIIDEINNDSENYMEIERMEINYSCNLMEKFINTIEDKQLSEKLSNAIKESKPFDSFKKELDNSAEYKRNWNEYKSLQITEWIKEQVLPKSDISEEDDYDD